MKWSVGYVLDSGFFLSKIPRPAPWRFMAEALVIPLINIHVGREMCQHLPLTLYFSQQYMYIYLTRGYINKVQENIDTIIVSQPHYLNELVTFGDGIGLLAGYSRTITITQIHN